MTLAGVLAALAAIGVPLFVIIGAVTALVWALYSGEISSFSDLTRLIEPMESLATKDEFLAIPLFVASGAIMTKGGIAVRLVAVMRAALGWMPGGLAVASVAACMFFAAISGSSPVTLIAVGSIMVPSMIQARYPENFALGMVMTAGSLGCLVPPSISMLIYAISVSGVSGNVDPSDLFLAGLVPAVAIAGALALYSVWVGRKIPGPREPFSWRGLGRATYDGIWALALPVLILGGIYGGLYTPSRAGAVAVLYALFVTMFIYREMDWRGAIKALSEAGRLMGMLVLIIGLAFGLNEFLADIQIDEVLKDLVVEWDLGPVGFMLVVNAVLIILGALMDSISATLIFAPMLAPIAVDHYGMDPLHFGVVFVVNMEIGYLMPPVATNLFVAAATFKKPFGQVTRAVLPTLGITIAALVVFMYVPTCSKGLVNLQRDVALWEDFPWNGKPAVTEVAPGDAPADEAPSGLNSLSDLSKKEADELLAPDAATADVKDGEVDPMAKYRDDEDPLGIGAAPTSDKADAIDAGPADAGPTAVDPMQKYKQYDDDPFGTGQ
jgi:C4-dicarboxylate transporter DctM subunit